MSDITCLRCGQSKSGFEKSPFPGAIGARILEGTCPDCWAQWLKQQTMLVNENRLNLADPRARKYLMEQTERHFFGEGADVASGYVPPSK